MDTRIERLLKECQEAIQTSKLLIEQSKESLLQNQELFEQAVAQRKPAAIARSGKPKGESGSSKQEENRENSV